MWDYNLALNKTYLIFGIRCKINEIVEINLKISTDSVIIWYTFLSNTKNKILSWYNTFHACVCRLRYTKYIHRCFVIKNWNNYKCIPEIWMYIISPCSLSLSLTHTLGTLEVDLNNCLSWRMSIFVLWFVYCHMTIREIHSRSLLPLFFEQYIYCFLLCYWTVKPTWLWPFYCPLISMMSCSAFVSLSYSACS